LKGHPARIDEILAIDERSRPKSTQAENLRAGQKILSRQFAQTTDDRVRAELKDISEQVKSLTAGADELRAELDDLLLRVPNLFHESVPVGEGEQDNVVLRDWGSKADLGFAPRTHYDLGEALGIMDFERAARVAGSRFAFLIGEGARL